MAFETVRGQKVFSSTTGQTFVFSDYFTVFAGDSAPKIYEWRQISSVIENQSGIIITTNDDVFGIEHNAFESSYQYLNIRAIIEGQIAKDRSIKYKFTKRILPLKYLYRNANIPSNAFLLRGYYSEKEINTCNISLVSTRVGRYIFLLAIVLTVIITFFLHSMVTPADGTKWLLFFAIALFSAIAISVIIYLIIALVARHKYNIVEKIDPAVDEEITLVVAPEGFGAVESFIYTGCDLIPWSEANFFIETHAGIVILRDNKSIFWLPRTFMPKDMQQNILAFIAARVKQR